MKNYNVSKSFGVHNIEVVFQQWQYTKTWTTQVGGNCKGHSVLEAAITNIYEAMEEQPDPNAIVLVAPNGDTLECIDEEDRGEAWLEDMVVSMRVLSFKPERPSSAKPTATPAEGSDDAQP